MAATDRKSGQEVTTDRTSAARIGQYKKIKKINQQSRQKTDTNCS